jgi:hypothetical protein
MTRYWIIVASADHVAKGVEEGFAQACHGKAGPLKRLKQGDRIVYYSPRQVFGEKEPCQAFTALGEVSGTAVYPFALSEDFIPHRRDIRFESIQAVPIQPLIEHLSFIRNKSHWGMAFRFGFFEIPAWDFDLIATALRRTSPTLTHV